MEDNDLISQIVDEVIRKSSDKDEWCLYSKKKNKKTKKKRNLGCYKSRKGAKKREKQVQYFKSVSESSSLGGKLTLSKSPIHGIGIFSKSHLLPHTNLGVAQIRNRENQYNITTLGKYHNHSSSPSCYNKMIGNKRYLFTSRSMDPGEEITIDYTLQPDLEQPQQGWLGDISESNKSLNILNNSIELTDIYLWERSMTQNSSRAKALLSDLMVEEKKKSKKNKGKDKKKYGTDVANSEKEVARMDAWAGGDNLSNPTDWMKVGGIKLEESQLRRIIAEELEGIISESLKDWMPGRDWAANQYRRRKRRHDIDQSDPGALDADVEDTAHQLHVVVLQKPLHPQATWSTREVIKLSGIPGGYTDASQLDNDKELNTTIKDLKMKHGGFAIGAPKTDIQVWQETSKDAPQFKMGGRNINATPIPGSAGEVGIMLFSV
jgi:hypothetical protein